MGNLDGLAGLPGGIRFQHREQARLAIALGGVALPGRAVILAQLEQGRLPGARLGLCLAQRDQVALDITPAVNLNEAGQGHWHHSGSSSASPATSSLSVGEMSRNPQSGQSSSNWQDQVSDHS